MATYKLIQDIEAEDKILGPLTLRQFVYGGISVLFLYICFLCISKHIAFMLVLFLPPALFTGFFALPFGKDQPTEVWALAKIRFYFKPRKRIWDQSGVKEQVTITVPKKIERNLTNGLSQTEVASRLSALANTIDSRGWAIKNVNVNLYMQPDPFTLADSDRLIDPSSMPQEVPNFDVQASDDILDERSNPIAQQFDQLITASSQAHRQQLIDTMNVPQATPGPLAQSTAAQTPADYWFLNQPTAPTNLAPDQGTFTKSQVILPGAAEDSFAPAQDATPEDTATAAALKAHNATQQVSYAHLRTLQPLSQQTTTVGPAVPPQAALPTVPTQLATRDVEIQRLARTNDFSVTTLAHEAHKANDDDTLDNEVVIPLR